MLLTVCRNRAFGKSLLRPVFEPFNFVGNPRAARMEGAGLRSRRVRYL